MITKEQLTKLKNSQKYLDSLDFIDYIRDLENIIYGNEIKKLIEEKYEITGNSLDIVPCKQINDYLRIGKKIDMSNKKLTIELARIGIDTPVNPVRINGIKTRIKTGLKLREDYIEDYD